MTFKSAAGALAVGLAVIAWQGEAQAAPVSASETQEQTVDGENFTFTFNGADGIVVPMPGTGGTLVFTFTEIDITTNSNSSNETFTFDIDMVVSGGPIRRPDIPVGDYTFIDAANASFTYEVALSDAELASILADLAAVVTVDLGAPVNVSGPTNDITVTLNYQALMVPEPDTLALFGLGLAGVGFAARRKRNSQTR